MTEMTTEVMIQYLLDELPEQERSALEEKYFDDPQIFDEMSKVEEDLIDDYVRDRLPSSQRQKFEQVYLGNEQRKARVRFAQALVTQVDQPGTVQAANKESFWSRLLLPIQVNRLAAGLSFAAAVLMLVGGAWLYLQYLQLKQDLNRAHSIQSASAEREQILQKQLADERNKSNQLAEELNKRPTLPTNQNSFPTSFVSLIIAVAGTRDGNTSGPTSLSLPSSANEVRLQIRLGDSAYSRYNVKVQTADSRDVFGQRNVTARGNAVNVVVPAAKFQSGDYVVVVQGVTTNGDAEDVSKSFVHVTKH